MGNMQGNQYTTTRDKAYGYYCVATCCVLFYLVSKKHTYWLHALLQKPAHCPIFKYNYVRLRRCQHLLAAIRLPLLQGIPHV